MLTTITILFRIAWYSVCCHRDANERWMVGCNYSWIFHEKRYEVGTSDVHVFRELCGYLVYTDDSCYIARF